MNETGQSRFNQARIEWDIRLEYSPLPRLDFDVVSRNLNAYRIGELRLCGRMFSIMMELDGELGTNADKRASDLAALDWSIVSDGSADGDKHAEALTYFYNHLKATEALHQDKVGGVPELLKQMLSAHSNLYSAHEILLRVDNAAACEVTAEFRHTPVWFFEARRGYLAYLEHIFDVYGKPCMEGEWLTCVGSGWMRPLSVAYTFKQFAMRDWAIFCTRYGSGFLEGITDAQKGDPAWEEAHESLSIMANDGACLHNEGLTMKFLDNPAKANLPFPSIVELANGLFAKCYRGVEMATGSRGASGGGQEGSAGAKNPVGASIMSEESGIFLASDAAWANGYLNERVDRPLMRYLFDEEPRARFVVSPPEDDTSQDDVTTMKTMVPLGMPITLKEAYEVTGFTPPAQGEPCLTPPAPPAVPSPGKEGQAEGEPAAPPVPPATSVVPIAAAPKSADPAKASTIPAQAAKAIGAGADPLSMAPQGPTPQMPDPQINAAGFWSRAGQFFAGAAAATARAVTGPFSRRLTDGTLPALAYAIPNEKPAGEGLSEDFEAKAREQYARGVHADLQHAAAKIQALLQIDDAEHFASKAKELSDAWEKITGNTLVAPSAADALAPIVATAFLKGLSPDKDALANWDPDQPRVPAGSPGGGQFASARDKVAAVRDGKLDESAYAKVSPETALKIRAATGLDVSGHSHFIDHESVVHIHRQHGVGKEHQQGHLPVTKGDIEKIPDIVAKPDSVIIGTKSRRGLPSHVYSQRQSDGTIHYVEEHWRGDKLLAAKTMWKTSAPGNGATPFGGVLHTSGTSGAKKT